jgi:hypothetical protein
MVMVPAWPGQPSCAELGRLASSGARPRTDYVELARVLNADVMDFQYMREQATRSVWAIANRVGIVEAQIAKAFPRRRHYAHVVARADRLGLPLTLLLKLVRSRQDLVLISVWLSRQKKAVFLRNFRVHSHMSAIVNYSSVQMNIAADRLGVPREKLHLALQPVDERFWRPTTSGSCPPGAIRVANSPPAGRPGQRWQRPVTASAPSRRWSGSAFPPSWWCKTSTGSCAGGVVLSARELDQAVPLPRPVRLRAAGALHRAQARLAARLT